MTISFRNNNIDIVKFRSLRFVNAYRICQFKILLNFLFRQIPSLFIFAIFSSIIISELLSAFI